MRAIVLHEKLPSFGLSALRDALGPTDWAIAATADFGNRDDQLKIGSQASSVNAIASSNSRDILEVADHLFRHTNSIDAHWADVAANVPDCTLVPRDSLRSTSVGDVILVEASPGQITALLCASSGWTELSQEQITEMNLTSLVGSASGAFAQNGALR